MAPPFQASSLSSMSTGGDQLPWSAARLDQKLSIGWLAETDDIAPPWSDCLFSSLGPDRVKRRQSLWVISLAGARIGAMASIAPRSTCLPHNAYTDSQAHPVQATRDQPVLAHDQVHA
jgi:hypothetical protein